MKKEVIIADDWTRNWNGSIAIKTTAIVTWVLVLVAFIAIMIWANKVEHDFLNENIQKVNHLSLTIDNLLYKQSNIDDAEFKNIITSTYESAGFIGVDLMIEGQHFVFGETTKDIDFIKSEFQHLQTGNNSLVVLKAYYPNIEMLISEKRNHVVMITFIIILIFAALLILAIHFIVHSPLSVMIDTTKAISEGEKDLRLDGSREDEFGHLSRFFNEMLDSLQLRQLDKLREKQHELEIAMEKVRVASKAKSDFLAKMSHELRTPLNAIIGYSELLIEDAEAEGQINLKSDLNRINIAGNHLHELINNVLDLSKIESGKMEVNCNKFNLKEMISNISSIIHPLIEKNNNVLDIHFDTKMETIVADERKLQQAILNLLSNAAKFTNKGEIKLRVSDVHENNHNWMKISVVDTGIGIEQKSLNNLFQDFTQADSSTSAIFGGTGLGLSISKRFCNMMGGDIFAESEIGKGSRFVIKISLNVEEYCLNLNSKN